MVTFGNYTFSPGEHRITPGRMALRGQLASGLSASGAALVPEGLTHRVIRQKGRLLADDSDGLHAICQEIELLIDGLPRDLTGSAGVTFPDVVMVQFEPAGSTRVGTRWAMDYRIDYVQVTP